MPKKKVAPGTRAHAKFNRAVNAAFPKSQKNVTPAIRAAFLLLVARQSPENLTGDGEFTPAQIAQRRKTIAAEWVALERTLGRQVTVAEVQVWWLDDSEAADDDPQV